MSVGDTVGVILLYQRIPSITGNICLNSKFTAVKRCLIKQFRVLFSQTLLKCCECLELETLPPCLLVVQMKVQKQRPLPDYSRRPGMPQHAGSRVQLVQCPALDSDKSLDNYLLLTSDPDSDIG